MYNVLIKKDYEPLKRMQKSKQTTKKGGAKSKDKKKWSGGVNQTTGLPLLKYGPDTNLPTWKVKVMSAAMVQFGNLAKLMSSDGYYKVPLVEPQDQNRANEPVPDGSTNEESKTSAPSSSSSGMTTRSSRSSENAGRRLDQSQMAIPTTLRAPPEIEALGEDMVKTWILERVKAQSRAEQKMFNERPNFYAFVEQHLSRESLDEIKKHENYKTFDREKDPLALWLAIKQTHEIATDSGVQVFRKHDSRSNYMNAKQGPYESITVFKTRFDYLYDAYINSGNADLNDEDIAADYLRSLDDGRYRELKISLENGELMGDDKMPKTLSAMHALACKFKVLKKASVTNHGTAFATSGNTDGGKKRKKGTPGSQSRSKEAEQDDKDDDNSSQMSTKSSKKFTCWLCGEPGHRKFECPQNDKTKEGNSYHTVFAISKKKKFKWNEVLLDNQSDVSIVDERLLTNVRDSEAPYVISGMGPTPLICNKVGYLEGFFECVAGTDLKANILSMAQVEDLYPVEYTQGEKYVIKMDERDLIARRRDRMYVVDMSDWACKDEDPERICMITTAEGNEAR